MSVFAPMPLPNISAQKQSVLAQLMQQHAQAAMRFAGQAPGSGLVGPMRAVAPPPPVQPRFGLHGVTIPEPPQPGAYPSAVFGPTIARLRSPGV